MQVLGFLGQGTHRANTNNRDDVCASPMNLPGSTARLASGGAGGDSRGAGSNGKKGACRCWKTTGTCTTGNQRPFAHEQHVRAPTEEGKHKRAPSNSPHRGSSKGSAMKDKSQCAAGAAHNEANICKFDIQGECKGKVGASTAARCRVTTARRIRRADLVNIAATLTRWPS